MSELEFKPLGKLESEERTPEDWERKVTGLLPAPEERDPAQPLHVILRVARAGYEPEGISVRARTSPQLLTAETTWRALPQLARDPLVVSVALAEKIGPVTARR